MGQGQQTVNQPDSEIETRVVASWFPAVARAMADGTPLRESTVEYFPFQKANTGSIVPAKLVKKVQPEYPVEAQKKGIEGTIACEKMGQLRSKML
jgi:hypothetical protein